MIKLSYIVPVYNVENYVHGCLESLYAQELSEEEFEVICVNDGSTDNSLRILEEFRKDHANMIIHTIPNGGLSNARNTGIRIAQGQYIFFIDSDDYIAENTVKQLLDIAISKRTDMLYFDFVRPYDTSLNTPKYFDIEACAEPINGKEYFAKRFPSNGAWLFLIRREFILEKQVFFEVGRFAEDGMFAVLSTNRADKVMYCHADVYRNVKRENSIVTRRDDGHLRKMVDDFAYAIEYINCFVEKEKRVSSSTSREYVCRLKERRNNYAFFMMIRMIRSNMTRSERKKVLSRLRKKNCYPNAGLPMKSGKKIAMLSKVFQIPVLFDLVCEGYRLIVKKS